MGPNRRQRQMFRGCGNAGYMQLFPSRPKTSYLIAAIEQDGAGSYYLPFSNQTLSSIDPVRNCISTVAMARRNNSSIAWKYSSARKVSAPPLFSICLLTNTSFYHHNMAPRRQLQPYKRSEIINQYKIKVPLQQISRNTGLRHSIIHYTIKQLNLCNNIQHNLLHKERPRKSIST